MSVRNGSPLAFITFRRSVHNSKIKSLDLPHFLFTFAPENQSGQIWLLATTSKNAKTAPLGQLCHPVGSAITVDSDGFLKVLSSHCHSLRI